MGTLDKASEAEVGTQTSSVSEREQARKRLQTQRDFASHVVAYIVINAFLIGIGETPPAGPYVYCIVSRRHARRDELTVGFHLNVRG